MHLHFPVRRFRHGTDREPMLAKVRKLVRSGWPTQITEEETELNCYPTPVGSVN